MEEARAVLDCLERIEQLRREGALAPTLLAELRELLREAEGWAQVEGGKAGEDAVSKLRAALAGGWVSGAGCLAKVSVHACS